MQVTSSTIAPGVSIGDEVKQPSVTEKITNSTPEQIKQSSAFVTQIQESDKAFSASQLQPKKEENEAAEQLSQTKSSKEEEKAEEDPNQETTSLKKDEPSPQNPTEESKDPNTRGSDSESNPVNNQPPRDLSEAEKQDMKEIINSATPQADTPEPNSKTPLIQKDTPADSGSCSCPKTLLVIGLIALSAIAFFAALCALNIFPSSFLGGTISCYSILGGSVALFVGCFAFLVILKKRNQAA